MHKDSFIRTIYLYLFALVGLAVLVIGVGNLIDLGLKAWVFTYADKTDRAYQYDMRPPLLNEDVDRAKVADLQANDSLTESQQLAIAQWLDDYDTWVQKSKDAEPFDYQKSNRQRQASRAISLIIVGLPLYLYHWAVIKRDRQEKTA
ncbi:MAG: hypothetical protein ACKKL5_02805 [Candidatus Komeilibacteria bacterium]